MATLIYSSSWSPIRPSVYSDDTDNEAVNKLIDAIFTARTKRLIVKNNKFYYASSKDYKKYVVRMKKFR
jgi:hypothetical protein